LTVSAARHLNHLTVAGSRRLCLTVAAASALPSAAGRALAGVDGSAVAHEHRLALRRSLPVLLSRSRWSIRRRGRGGIPTSGVERHDWRTNVNGRARLDVQLRDDTRERRRQLDERF